LPTLITTRLLAVAGRFFDLVEYEVRGKKAPDLKFDWLNERADQAGLLVYAWATLAVIGLVIMVAMGFVVHALFGTGSRNPAFFLGAMIAAFAVLGMGFQVVRFVACVLLRIPSQRLVAPLERRWRWLTQPNDLDVALQVLVFLPVAAAILR